MDEIPKIQTLESGASELNGLDKSRIPDEMDWTRKASKLDKNPQNLFESKRSRHFSQKFSHILLSVEC